MNFLILTTGSGNKYGKRITSEIRRLGHNAYKYRCWSLDLAFRNHPEWTVDNLIIHSRAANPTAIWMDRLIELERLGFRVINNTEALSLTSDKWESYLRLRNIGNIPESVLLDKVELNVRNVYSIINRLQTGYVIFKPRISQGQGMFVYRWPIGRSSNADLGNFVNLLSGIPCRQIIAQKFIPYFAIYRVFLIGDRVLPFVTVDTPTDNRWKVSVCLNPDQRISNHPPRELLDFARSIKRAIGGEINFIDVFNTPDGYVLSEVNTACNLTIHERLSGYNIAKDIARYLIDQST